MSGIFGWSYPPGCSGTLWDEDRPCDVCGKDVDRCICPECKVCGCQGDPQLTTAQAQDTKEALRRLGTVEMPLHVVAGEYADLKRSIGERGTLRQAVEFYLHNSIRPDMERTVSQVVEEFTASRRANGCCQLYIDDCRLRLGAFGRAFQMPITHLLTMDMEKWLGRIVAEDKTSGRANARDFRFRKKSFRPAARYALIPGSTKEP